MFSGWYPFSGTHPPLPASSTFPSVLDCPHQYNNIPVFSFFKKEAFIVYTVSLFLQLPTHNSCTLNPVNSTLDEELPVVIVSGSSPSVPPQITSVKTLPSSGPKNAFAMVSDGLTLPDPAVTSVFFLLINTTQSKRPLLASWNSSLSFQWTTFFSWFSSYEKGHFVQHLPWLFLPLCWAPKSQFICVFCANSLSQATLSQWLWNTWPLKFFNMTIVTLKFFNMTM